MPAGKNKSDDVHDDDGDFVPLPDINDNYGNDHIYGGDPTLLEL